jgi:alpha-L-rhamnosidase
LNYLDGSAGWSDSIEIVPYKLWRRYNDDTVVRENYDCLKRYLNFCLERSKTTREEYQWLPKDLQPFFADQGMHWGEWLEPGADTLADMMYIGRHGEPEVATAYLAYGCALASEMAAQLGKAEDSAYFSNTAEKAKQAYRTAFVKDGIIDSPRQCRYVRPIALNLLTEDEKRVNAAILARKIAENGYKLNTGFLTTSELCRVLTDYGHTETAYRLLLQTESPSWLYSVEKGATSILEQWDGIKADGSVAASFNHYSYGSVVGWLFDRVCGIRLDKGKIRIQPVPSALLGSVSAEYHSPFGVIRSAWKYDGDTVVFGIAVPRDAKATIVLPDNSIHNVDAGEYRFEMKKENNDA